METAKTLEQKQVRVLKCTECGQVYIFDSDHKHCPKCGGELKETVIKV